MRKFLAIVILGCWLIAPAAHAKTSVWRVTAHGTELYLGGTIHFLSKGDYPLPCEFEAAYAKSGHIFLETDISAFKSPQFAARYAGQIVYPNGETIRDKLSPQTYAALTDYFGTSGVPMAALDKLKPGMLMGIALSAELKRIGINSEGVDQYFATKSAADAKPVGALETADSQMKLLIEMGLGNEEQFIKYLLKSMTELKVQFEKMTDSWRRGDVKRLSQASQVDKMRRLHPRIFEQLIQARNMDWMHHIEAMFKTPEVEFVLVGALHMATEVGLLDQLRRRGYKVEQLDGC